MGGWCVATLDVDSQETAEELVASLNGEGFITEEEGGYAQVLGSYDNEPAVGVVGASGMIMEEGREKLEEFLVDQLDGDRCKRFIAINANNTTDSGDGAYWIYEDGEWTQKDEKEGVNRANAADVAAYFREEYGFQPRTRPGF